MTRTPTASNTPVPVMPVTITYTYDALYRLTQAKMFGGQETTDTYAYDDANRLTTVNGVEYTWDNIGNLPSGGVNSYGYDAANRLVSLSDGASAFSYSYNGLGNRLQQTINGQPTHYAMDINTGLPNVLSQAGGTRTDYFLGDALGATRHFTDPSGHTAPPASYISILYCFLRPACPVLESWYG